MNRRNKPNKIRKLNMFARVTLKTGAMIRGPRAYAGATTYERRSEPAPSHWWASGCARVPADADAGFGGADHAPVERHRTGQFIRGRGLLAWPGHAAGAGRDQHPATGAAGAGTRQARRPAAATRLRRRHV